MDEEVMVAPSEPPALVELGEFSEGTPGGWPGHAVDSTSRWGAAS